MKKLIPLLIIVFLVVFIILIIFFFFKNRKTNIRIDSVKHMRLSYSTGTMMDANVVYEVDEKDGKYVAGIKPDGVADEGKIEVELDEDTMEKIMEILNKYDVVSWNKFHKTDKNVLDGDGFSFNLRTNDGKEISASGYMMWPKNYHNVVGELDGIFNRLYDSMRINDIEYMYYSSSKFDLEDSSVLYVIKKKDDKYFANVKFGEEEKEIEIDKNMIDEILEIFNRYNISLWNGFQKDDVNTLDGSSFYFKLNDQVQASGYMMWPDNYDEVMDYLHTFFTKLYEKN